MTRFMHNTQTTLARRPETAEPSGPTSASAEPSRKRTLRARMVGAFVAAVASIGLAAAPAHAVTANGGIYVVTPAWWGHCANFGGVAGLATVNSYVGHSNAGDYGDDIAWVPVRLRTSQSIQVRVACKRYGFAAGASMSVTITPARHGQSFFIGPDSRYWSN